MELSPDEYLQWKETIDWEDYKEYAESNSYSYKDIKWLNAMLGRRASWKQIKAAKAVVDKIDSDQSKNEFDDGYDEVKDTQPVKHLTVRVAWHDNKWNGKVCNDPVNNIYCNGYHSLLSERIRRRKNADLEQNYYGQKVEEIQKEGYTPPCFWSINAFGDQEITVDHDNPAEPKITPIKEILPPNSVFSWPFALSFVRNPKEESIEGAYPRNLEEVLVPHFQNKLKAEESLVFLYANYDNPVSGEDQEYLVVGVGLLKEKAPSTRFNGQEDIFEKKRKLRYPNNKNFPRINWALRYSLDWPKNCVRLPYHEYLEDAEKTKDYSRLDRLKVSISEPELIHNFKYVAMDVDHDACIYLLSKIRQKLLDIKDEAIIAPAEVEKDLRKIEYFLGMVWDKRGYLPGLNALSKVLLPHLQESLNFDSLIEDLKTEDEDYIALLEALIENPRSNDDYRAFSTFLEELNRAISENHNISVSEFIQLAMLNLTHRQFERIVILGQLGEESPIRDIKEICNNPYLLFEEYEPKEGVDALDPNTGEQIDFPVELFKIDIAYFPHTKYLQRTALQQDFKNTDARRVRALIIHHLKSLESRGHCFDEARTIEQALKNYPLFYRINEDYQLPLDFLIRITNEYEAKLSEKLEIVEQNDTKYFYLKEIYNAEQKIANDLQSLLKLDPLNEVYQDLDSYLKYSCSDLRGKIQLFDEKLFEEERRKLYKNILNKRLYVLTGSPGSGKSHELLKIISYLQSKNEKCLVLAPTGKAALRLSTDEMFKDIEALTIDKHIHKCRKSPHRKEDYHNIIVDEMSMVDLIKFRDLLKTFNFNKPSFKRLILVGDPNQLPPIGYGKVFSDLKNYLVQEEMCADNFIELEVNCRQTLESEIIDFSKIFSDYNQLPVELEEKVAQGGDISSKGSFQVHYWSREEQLKEMMLSRLIELGGDKTIPVNTILDQLLETNGKRKVDGFQILSPYRTGLAGSGKINTFFQQTVRGTVPFIENSKLVFKETDKVIQISNVYMGKELALSNGSLGLVEERGIYFPERGDQAVSFYDGLLRQEELELAYCVTVHKSQGSGFDNVFVVIPERFTLLSKELLYTALTRSKETMTVFIQGSPSSKFEDTLFERIRNRSYSAIRKTSLFSLPFWDFSLEPEKGVFVKSRVEYIIYNILKQYREEIEGVEFFYEKAPVINDDELKMKTDFTVNTPSGNTYYWEHLGLIGSRYYERKWQYKREKYQEAGVEGNLLTTDETKGINEAKVQSIIELILNDTLGTEEKYHKYSLHHYYLR